MIEWQPIVTAPKDGTLILAHQPPNDYCVVWWCDFRNEWRDYGDIGASGQEDYEPTHWAPLSKPITPGSGSESV